MKVFKIKTKDDTVIVEAKNKDYAFAKYFLDIIENKVSIDKIGNLLILQDETGEKYVMRTVPLLWSMGIIDDKTAIETLKQLLGISKKEAGSVLVLAGENDIRLIPFIEELKLKGAPKNEL